MNIRFRLAILALVLSPLVARGADVTISSPVGGYYRVGKFTPVEVTGGLSGVRHIAADGMVPVKIDGGGAGTIAPMLVIAPTRGHFTVRAGGGTTEAIDLSMRPLGDDERLVALVGDVSPADAQPLFPGKSIVPLKLDATRLFTGTPAAWEVFDAILFADVSRPLTEEVSYRTWLGSGMTIAVRSPPEPASVFFKWKHRGPWWVLQYDPLGGGANALNEDGSAYAPVSGWHPGASPRTRAIVFAFGVIFAILALAASLLRDRFFVTAALVIVTVGSLNLVHLWSKRLPAQYDVASSACIVNGDMFQWDLWKYATPARDGAVVACPCIVDSGGPGPGQDTHAAGRPMIISPEQARRQALMLELDVGGEPGRWTARLGRGERLAVVTTLVNSLRRGEGELPPAPPAPGATDSPMRSLIGEFYSGAGLRAIGPIPPPPAPNLSVGGDSFADIYLERDAAAAGATTTAPTPR